MGYRRCQLGMPDVTFHALRHSHASQLIDGGVDVVTISKRLGHANPTVTLAIYATCSARTTARPPRRLTRL
jgi:integrase